jgi:myo-inositol 2-dehydrogenase/D-chiro-inositol 1-dehydrogenase
MRFALIGDHPDGLALALALEATGRHELARYAGPPLGADWLAQRGVVLRLTSDLEELFADPDLELLLVADDLEHRAEVLRRAVRTERHVLCVHPADTLPDITYEAAMVQQETHKVLLPILTARLSPGLGKLRELWQSGVLGPVTTIEGEFCLPAPVADMPPPAAAKSKKRRSPKPAGNWDVSPLVTLWDALRFLAGEVKEVSALGIDGDTLNPSDPLTLTGRFESGVIFQVLLRQAGANKLTLRGADGEATLMLAHPAELHWRIGEQHHQLSWDGQPWPDFIREFENAVDGKPTKLAWLDGTRCLELFEAVRQSVKRRRVIPMQYEEFSEGANFKTVMTTLGCLTLILVLVLFVILLAVGAPLAPWSLYLLLPLLLLFIVLQALGWLVPRGDQR